ncbi:MAG: hypothetical protein HY301_14225 [Verrucomicrobia bacterium]|nr:hypothetical protein [Verrucomicrobiota bacterium]
MKASPVPVPEDASATPPPPAPKWFTLSLTPRAFTALLVCALLITGLLVGGNLWRPRAVVDHPSLSRDGFLPCKPGPWGDLEYLPITIEPPEEHITLPRLKPEEVRWFFPDHTPEKLAALFEQADLQPAERATLLDRQRWEMLSKGIRVNPGVAVLHSLRRASRRVIYEVLIANVADNPSADFFTLPAKGFEELFTDSRVPRPTIDLVRQLCFPRGDHLVFADLTLALDTLAEYPQKISLVRALDRRPTLLLRLRVRPGDKLEDLSAYWGKSVWHKDVVPMLEALHRVPGSASMSIAWLLPPLPSSQLNTFPLPSQATNELHKDCHWTSMNFFRAEPDDRFQNKVFVAETLKRDYFPISSGARFGDIVTFTRPNGDIIHSMVFIADDILFTKNGATPLSPWILMRLKDVQVCFAEQIPNGDRLFVQAYRCKNL